MNIFKTSIKDLKILFEQFLSLNSFIELKIEISASQNRYFNRNQEV